MLSAQPVWLCLPQTAEFIGTEQEWRWGQGPGFRVAVGAVADKQLPTTVTCHLTIRDPPRSPSCPGAGLL